MLTKIIVSICVVLTWSTQSAAASANLYGITSTVPEHPVAGEPLVMHLTIPTSNSGGSAGPHTAKIYGNKIRVDGCYYGGGFAVPGYITAVVPIPPVPAGDYSVEYYGRSVCGLAPPYTALATFALTVPARTSTYPPPPGPIARVARYFNVDTGFYFMTSSDPEQIAIESGTFAGWQPVNVDPMEPNNFGFFRDAGAGRANVCRFFSEAFAPKGSHFFSAEPAECESVKRNPLWIFEGYVGYVALGDAGGNCSGGLIPLYRMYNNGVGGAPTHIFTVLKEWYQALTQVGGWRAEGVLGCVPPL